MGAEESNYEQRFGVIFFSDIIGSTAMNRRLKPAKYAPVVERHHAILRRVAKQHGGDVDRDNGDGMLAYFATPSQAVRAALQFQDEWSQLTWEGAEWEGQPRPQVGIGLHVGEIVLIPTAVGDAINFASRFCNLAQGDQILISSQMQLYAHEHIVENRYQWKSHGYYQFKGAEEPMEVYEVIDAERIEFRRPLDKEDAKRLWRPEAGLPIPGRPGWILQRKLGEGGYGEVWLAQHEKLRQRVFKFCFHPARLPALRKEVAIYQQLFEELGERRDIAAILDMNFEEPPFFLELAYVQSGDLPTWAEEKGMDNIPLETRVSIVARVARTLADAHNAQVVHRDVKPSNILIREEGTEVCPVLADFGVGMADKERLKAQGFLNSTKTLDSTAPRGTPMYQPPETLRGRPHEKPGDIYSLGIVLYQLVIGDFKKPLGIGWEQDVEDQPLREDIARCVQGEPTNRFSSMGELAQALESLGQRRAALRWYIFRRWSIGITLAIGLVVTLGLAEYWHQATLRMDAEHAQANAERALADLQRETARSKAAILMAALGGVEDVPSYQEYLALQALADSAPGVRMAFLGQLLESPGKSHRLRKLFPHFMHAIVGLDVKQRDEVELLLTKFPQGMSRNPNPLAVAKLGYFLGSTNVALGGVIRSNLIGVIERENDEVELAFLAQTLVEMLRDLEPRDAYRTMLGLLRSIESDKKAIRLLGEPLVKLSARLTPELAESMGKKIIASLEQDELGERLYVLTALFAGLADRMSAELELKGVEVIWAAPKTDRAEDLAAFGIAMAKFSRTSVHRPLNYLLSEINADGDRSAGGYSATDLGMIARAMSALAARLPADDSLLTESVLPQLVRRRKDAVLLEIGTRLGPAQAGPLAAAALSQLNATEDPTLSRSLRGLLLIVCSKLEAGDAGHLAERILREVTEWEDMGEILDVLLSRTADEQLPRLTERMTRQLLASVRARDGFAAARALIASLSRLGNRFPSPQAEELSQAITDLISTEADLDLLIKRARILSGLGQNLPERYAASAIGQLTAFLGRRTNHSDRVSLALAMGGFGEALSSESAHQCARLITELMRETDRSLVLQSLGEALGQLGQKLRAQDWPQLARELVATMDRTDDPYVLEALSQTLGQAELSEALLSRAVRRLLEMAESSSPSYRVQFSQALHALGKPAVLQARELVSDSRFRHANELVPLLSDEPASVDRGLDLIGFIEAGDRAGLTGELTLFAEKSEFADLAAVLKSIVCVGETRRRVLAVLEKRAGRRFSGNVWSALQWLDELDVNVRSIAANPLIRPQ